VASSNTVESLLQRILDAQEDIQRRLTLVETRSPQRSRAPTPPISQAASETATTEKPSITPSYSFQTPPQTPVKTASETASAATQVVPKFKPATEDADFDATGLPKTPNTAGSTFTAPRFLRKGKPLGKGRKPKTTELLLSHVEETSEEQEEDATKQRRSTIFKSRTLSAEKSARQVVVHGTQPKYDHIMLDFLTVRKIFAFWEAVNNYQKAHSIMLPLNTLIAEKVRYNLAARNGLTDESFYDLTREQLYEYMTKYIRPSSRLEFSTKLSSNISFGGTLNYKPTAEYFRPFYEDLLAYKNLYTKVYELLAENNAANVPELKNKDGGLLKIFIEKIPFEYGTRVFQIINGTKFEDIYKFLSKFYGVVEEHHGYHLGAVQVRQAFGGTAYESKKIEHKVHALENVDEDPGFEDVRPDAYDSDPEFESNLAALQQGPPNASANREPLACLSKMLHGTCTKKFCKYEHGEGICYKARASFIDMLQKQQAAAPKPSSHHAPTPRPGNKFSHMDMDNEHINHDFAHIAAMQAEDNEFAQLREDISHDLCTMSSTFFHRAVHREGVILLDEDVCLPVGDVLFDTGAVGASYISEQYFNDHSFDLDSLVQPVRGRVRLAAHKTTVVISKRLPLTVSFECNGVTHAANILFYVLPSSNNAMVIGLPAIIMNFGPLFLTMMQTAMEEYIGEPSHTLAQIDSDLREPWSLPPDIEAPEDSVVDTPCSFSEVLNFMETTPEEAKKEYFAQMDTHVSEPFRTATAVIDLLKSEKSVRAFVPQNWEGIKNIPPLELVFRPTLPDRLKPHVRPINPRLFAAVEKEVKRLIAIGYLKPSRSPIASPLVVAPKATEPFIRLCIDLRVVNSHIETHHYPIPNVQHQLGKICRFPIFIDADLTNAFHQHRLAHTTSERLSVVTPWGQFAPQFMPEGVAPASFILQEVVNDIFRDFEEWTIAIFDNLLILAHDYNDAYEKLEKVIDRCNEFNLYLKFSKTWLGFQKVLFFGYECTHKSWTLAEDRKQAIRDYVPPRTLKQMQSFLGAALYFQTHVDMYAVLAAPLNDMTKNDCRWDASIWTPERIEALKAFKQSLIDCVSLFYPDYELPWIMRTDASRVGVGVVLFQVFRKNPESEPELQPFAIASHKFSPQAQNWDTHRQELYALVYGCNKFEYYLRGKEFVIETDHANLQWMEQSKVPQVTRWRIFLQSFNFKLRHIKGKDNVFADALSRQFAEEPDTEDTSLPKDSTVPAQFLANVEEVQVGEPQQKSWSQILSEVHGGRVGHHGARRTHLLIRQLFPGANVPHKFVEDYVSSCAVCQKTRLGMSDALQPIYRTLKSENKRKAVGVDTLTVTPADKHGNKYIIVIVVHTTKLVSLYPSADKSAEQTATALFRFFATYGVYETLISDPGSDLMSDVVAQLTAWYGVKHVFSLVDRHESNGVEGTNKSILRHLTALVADERILDRWSDPTVLPLVQYLLNSQVSHETGLTPFHAHFGTDDSTYMRLPETRNAKEEAHEFVRLLDQDLRSLWDTSKKFQAGIIAKRGGNMDPEKQNRYQRGDLVLFHLDTSKPLPTKLTMRFSGPFEVISHDKNDVQCRHLCMKTVHTFHVERLKPFFGSREDAERVALLDHDQYEVQEILFYRGDPLVRTTMEFFIRFTDGDQRWVTWNKDLFDSVPYEMFCRARSELFPLVYTLKEAERRIKEINQRPIAAVAPGHTVYVDLRSRGSCTWYESIGLPRSEELKYVLRCTYMAWIGTQKRKLSLRCDLLQITYTVDHYFVFSYGSVTHFDAAQMVLVDKDLCKKYPKIMPKGK